MSPQHQTMKKPLLRNLLSPNKPKQKKLRYNLLLSPNKLKPKKMSEYQNHNLLSLNLNNQKKHLLKILNKYPWNHLRSNINNQKIRNNNPKKKSPRHRWYQKEAKFANNWTIYILRSKTVLAKAATRSRPAKMALFI